MKYILITLILSISLISCTNEKKTDIKVTTNSEQTQAKEKTQTEEKMPNTKVDTVKEEESTGSKEDDTKIAEELKKEIQSIEPIQESTGFTDTGSTKELETEVDDLLNEFIDSLDTYE